MSERNWREWAFLLGMFGMVQLVILTSIAMFFYAGGTRLNPSAPGYSFWANWFSDLGRTKGYSGKDNTVSMIIFIIASSVRGISLIITAIALPYFFRENSMEKWLSIIGTFFLIIWGISMVGAAFTPWDIYFNEHMGFGQLAGNMIFIGGILYIIVIFHNKDYSNKYALLVIVMLSAGFIFTVFVTNVLNWPQVSLREISTREELMFHTVRQKITNYISISVNFLIYYGAWKQLKS